jgi:hypothetical protein
MLTVAAPQSDRSSVPAPADAPADPSLDPNRVGVVFVHGIGTQPACETFLDWSGSIVRVLRDWCLDHDYVRDPVRLCDYDLSGARLSILEVDVPAHDGHDAQTWVMTEAWWAATTRSPGLGSMTAYVRHALRPIMAGIHEGYDLRAAAWQQRRTEARGYAAGNEGYANAPLVLGNLQGRVDWVGALDRIQKELTVLAFGPALVLGQIVLWLYAPLRAIPIKQVQNLAALKSADNMLVHWFGELPDITIDPIQSANVRSRLVGAIKGLQAQGCGRIVVVAHSGGAIVSYTTLCDSAFLDMGVDKLITLGEGLALAWRIEGATHGLTPGSRLLGDLTAMRPNLRWADFWSTYDPAPAGPMNPPPGACVADRSYSTVNRMSILEDHGSYWDNDEEFMIPLLQNIDTPTGDPENSRFFRDSCLETVRLAWRRRRVAVLALWRWVATLGALIPISVTTVTGLLAAAGVSGLASRHGPARLGSDFASWWATIPGHQLIAGPLDGLSKAATWPGALPAIGEWAIGTAIIVVAFLLLAKFGAARWSAWDISERLAARRRVPANGTGWRPAITFGSLTLITAAMSAIVFLYLWR